MKKLPWFKVQKKGLKTSKKNKNKINNKSRNNTKKSKFGYKEKHMSRTKTI